MLEFLKPPSLLLHFSYYTLMTTLMLSVILLSMLMKPLSALSVIRIVHLVCGNNQSWLLNLNLTNKTLYWGKKQVVDFNAGKTYLVSLVWPNISGAVNGKMDGSVLQEKSLFKMLELSLTSELDWDFYMISVAATVSKKIKVLIRSMKFFCLRLLFFQHRSKQP